MSCSEKIKNHSYDFFDNITNYMKDGNSIESTITSMQASQNCNSFSKALANKLGSEQNAKNICDLFTKLYNYLPNLKNKKEHDPNYKKDCELLNYWLNMKLNDGKIKVNTCVSELYNHIESQCSDIFGFNVDSLDFLYDIKKEELHKMTLLFSLYETYIKLHYILNKTGEVDTSLLLSHSTNCYNEYTKALLICNGETNKFCEKLKNFKSKYVELYTIVDNKGPNISKNFIRLEYNKDYKIILTSVLGTIFGVVLIFMIFYKFTPLRQLFKKNKRKLNEVHRNQGLEVKNMQLLDYENEETRFLPGRYDINYYSISNP
ncbi:Plasmodium vivax Vir protein, putative [Plasmodium vivax]|uniref:Vir protein, putative n=1 Tax=Plasmodium vivax TaxID=5855 RepID=A0A1G4EBC2_PLAVI|nr:Plasmodium vivax Vir protein, putative [Plasmodium vivax]SCA60686.1 Plasmodium vivax Vir protein, putative [Plasmodium vivax]